MPLSTRLRLTLRRVVSEATALPRTTSELAERRRTRAVTGGIVARRREFRGLRPGRREWQAKSAGGRLPLRDFYEQKKRSPPPGGLLDQKRLSCTIC